MVSPPALEVASAPASVAAAAPAVRTRAGKRLSIVAPCYNEQEVLDLFFARIDAELADGEIVCIFPEGKLTRDGEMNEFKRGVEKILERRPVPVIPMALRGLWGSFFSRRDGRAAMSQLPRRFWSRIELVATAPVHGNAATAESLQQIVAGLRGEWQ